MSDWKYIDEYETLPESDFIHCDTRDYHIICVKDEKYYKQIRKEICNKFGYGILSDFKFTKDEILKILKDLEIRSGGKGKWRMLSINNHNWLKYIRFIKWDDKYLAYNDTGSLKILSHKLLESPINEEYLNFH